MRRTIATRLQKSFQEAPHVFLEAQIDVTAAEALRAKVNGRLAKDAARVSLTVVIAKACAWALARHPLVNSHLVGAPGQEEIVMNAAVNIGIAVALEAAPDDPTRSGGLIVPVVRGVGDKGLEALAADIADVSKRARGNKLRPDDVSDGTFTISNLGMFGVDRFTAIINPPQVAILAVSAARKQFVPDADGNPVARPIMAVTLSADHRVVDGAVAARFLSDLRAALEDPALMLA
jgi:pyruvate dehydrogenase E2 component (dihydrolipoamide acetyltransferase)